MIFNCDKTNENELFDKNIIKVPEFYFNIIENNIQMEISDETKLNISNENISNKNLYPNNINKNPIEQEIKEIKDNNIGIYTEEKNSIFSTFGNKFDNKSKKLIFTTEAGENQVTDTKEIQTHIQSDNFSTNKSNLYPTSNLISL